jgi:signal transduction histidine kinase
LTTLQGVDDAQGLVDRLLPLAAEHLGLSTLWLYRKLPHDDEYVHLVGVAGSHAHHIRAAIPRLPIVGDPMVEALCRGEGPFHFDDLQTVPGLNREVIEAMGNRALVTAALVNIDDTQGFIGGGTFHDEGPRTLTPEGLDRWMQVVAVASTVVARLRYEELEHDRRALQALVAERQRLDSIGELAGGLAHDLNNLHMVIDHSLVFLEDAPLTDTQRADIETARSALTSASALTRRMLALAKRAPIARHTLDLRSAVDNVTALVSRTLPPTIELAVKAASSPVWVVGDQGLLEQLLLNLLINARDAMPQGGRLLVSVSVVREGDEHAALLEVHDSGIGMSAEVRARVFDPFFTTKGDDGTGLGLAVGYGIVAQHGGRIHCYSEPEVGTSFRVHLPLVDATPRASRSEPTQAPRGRGERILVVDDAAHVRLVLSRALTAAGYRVDTAADGQIAVDRIDEAFDLYLVDAIMPRLDGRATIEALRARHPEAPILLMSGYGVHQIATAFLDDLDVPALPKPIAPDALLAAVRHALDAAK